MFFPNVFFATLLKKKFCKISKIPFFIEHLWWLFLYFHVAIQPNNILKSHILLTYSLLKSFERIFTETWNLSFCFQPYLFISKLVVDKVLLQYLEFLFFLIYQLNAVVSIHSNVFYLATSTSKMLYANFFRVRFVTLCLFCKFLFKLFDFLWLSFITVCCFSYPLI